MTYLHRINATFWNFADIKLEKEKNEALTVFHFAKIKKSRVKFSY